MQQAEANTRASALGGEKGNEYLLLALGCDGDADVAHTYLGAVISFHFGLYRIVVRPCLDGILNQVDKDAADF